MLDLEPVQKVSVCLHEASTLLTEKCIFPCEGLIWLLISLQLTLRGNCKLAEGHILKARLRILDKGSPVYLRETA